MDERNEDGVRQGRRWEWEDAAGAFREALKRSPDAETEAKLRLGLGRSLRFLGRLEEAIQHLTMATALRPECPESHVLLGLAYTEVGRLDEAKAALFAAARLLPGWALPRRCLGVVFLQQGRFEEAAATLEIANEIDGSAAEPFALLGCAYQGLARFDKAHAALLEAVRIDPGAAPVWYSLGRLCAQLNDGNGFSAAWQALSGLDKALADHLVATEAFVLRTSGGGAWSYCYRPAGAAAPGGVSS